MYYLNFESTILMTNCIKKFQDYNKVFLNLNFMGNYYLNCQYISQGIYFREQDLLNFQNFYGENFVKFFQFNDYFSKMYQNLIQNFMDIFKDQLKVIMIDV